MDGAGGTGDLARLVPRLVLGWDAEAPGQTYRSIDGSLCFADISGFTKLSDRLARRGRRGAEELVETLDRVFGEMLDVAVARGGDLLKFGGDALLLFFRDEGHEVRAASASVAMRAVLRRAAAIPTSVGRLQLSMSVGIGSGPLDLFLLGSTHRELLVLGPVATLTAEVEHAAGPGQIALSRRTAAALPPKSLRPGLDGASLLRWRREPEAGMTVGPPPLVHAVVDPSDFLSTTMLSALPGGARIEAEHRTATVGFLRFGGVDDVLRGQGPAETAERLQDLVALVQEALAAESLTLFEVDVDVDGGKFFVGSGIPAGLEDDGGRMLRAARAVLGGNPPFPLQVGVARGHVFAAEVGSATRSSYSAMGDTTNTAARLAAKAPVGGLYAAPPVVDSARTVFALDGPQGLLLRGKPLPVLTYEVGAALGDRPDRTERSLPFLGRDAQLARLDELVEHGGVLTVTGFTGGGKSRLVSEALDRRPDREVFYLRGEPYRMNIAYGALRDRLRMLLRISRAAPEEMAIQLLAVLDELLPELLPVAALVGDVVSVPVPPSLEVRQLDPRFRPDRTADAVLHVLRRLHRRPVVVVADDAHWLDQSTSSLLQRVAAAAPEQGWSVLAVRRGDRDTGFVPSIGTRLDLGPLADDVMRELVHAATDAQPLRPHVVDEIVRNADGSPAYVEEVVRSLDQFTMGMNVPASLQAALAAQIDALSPGPRQVLRYASVLGRSFRLPVLQALLGELALPRVEWGREGLEQFLVDEPPDRIRFRSGLVRDAAYESLAFRVRMALHDRAREELEAVELDADAAAAVLAEHSSRAGDLERTWRYSVVAARRAASTGANGDAMRLYGQALDAGRRLGLALPERGQVWLELGDVRERAGLYDDAYDAFRQAGVRLAGDGRMQAVLRLRRARCRERCGRYTAALRELQAGIALLDGATDDAGVQLLADHQALHAMVRQGQQRPGAALEAAERALALARDTGATAAAARASEVLDWAERRTGRGDGTLHWQAARTRYEQLADHSSLARMTANLGVIRYFEGDWDGAIESYSQSRTALLAAGDVVQAAAAAANLAEVLVNRGQFEVAEAELAGARRVLRAAGMVDFASFVDLLLGRIYAGQGRVEEAVERLQSVIVTERASKRHASAIEAASYLADCLTGQARAEEALILLDDTIAAARGEQAVVGPAVARARANAYLAQGEWRRAAEQLASGLAEAQRQGLVYETMVLLARRRVVAVLSGEEDEAADGDRVADLRARLGIVGDPFEPPVLTAG